MTPETIAALLHESARDLDHIRERLLRLVLDVDDAATVDCIGDAVEALVTSGMLLAQARNMAMHQGAVPGPAAPAPRRDDYGTHT